MNIHVKFEVNNMLNLTGNCCVYFYDRKKNPLKDTNQTYSSVDGQVSVGNMYTPNYKNCTYNDFLLFIPYSELHLSVGYHELKFKIQIFDCNTISIASSNFYDFNVNWQGGQEIETISRRNSKQANYPDIKSIIQKVINYTPDGSAIISIGDLYVQFYAYDENTLVVEAVSDFYVPRIGNKGKEFKKMGFTIDQTSDIRNYTREYPTKDLPLIIKDIVVIFENIYKINFIDYKINDNC